MLKYQYKNLAYDKQHTVLKIKISFTAKVIVHITTNMALGMWLVLVNVALLSVSYGLSTDKSADQVLETIEKLVTENQKNQEVIARLMSDREEDRKE